MADVNIPLEHWRELRLNANCFVPALIVASSRGQGFSNADLHRAGQSAAIKGLSAHIVGTALKRQAVTHGKAEDLHRAYHKLDASIVTANGELGDNQIVGAFFAIPGFLDLLKAIDCNCEKFAKESGVSRDAVVHAAKGGRVTAGILTAFHEILSREGVQKSIRELATSNPLIKISPKQITGTPFSLNDLQLAPAILNGEVWP